MGTFEKPKTQKVKAQLDGKFKIISEDGTSDNTKIYYGDVLVEGVTNVNINIDAEVGVAQASFTVLMPVFNIELPLNKVKIIRTQLPVMDIINYLHTNDISTISNQEEAVDQDTTT